MDIFRIKGDVIARRDYSPPRHAVPIKRTTLHPHNQTREVENMHSNPNNHGQANKSYRQPAKSTPWITKSPKQAKDGMERGRNEHTRDSDGLNIRGEAQDQPMLGDIWAGKSRTVTTISSSGNSFSPPPPSYFSHWAFRGREESSSKSQLHSDIPEDRPMLVWCHSMVEILSASLEEKVIAQNEIATRDFVCDEASRTDRRESNFDALGESEEEKALSETYSEDGDGASVGSLEFVTMPEGYEGLVTRHGGCILERKQDELRGRSGRKDSAVVVFQI